MSKSLYMALMGLLVLIFSSCSLVKESKFESSDLKFWVESVNKKTMINDVPDGIINTTVNLSAAKNEYESVQLVFRPKKEITNFKITAGDFTGKHGKRIPKANIDIRYATYIELPLYKRSAPDPLPPLTDLTLAPEKNLPVYITVKVPAAAGAGKYKAPLVISWNGGEIKTFINLNIWDFALPEKPSCVTSFGCGYYSVFQKHNVTDGSKEAMELKKNYYSMLLDYKISTYYLPVAIDSPDAGKYLNDPRLTSFVIPYNGNEEYLKKITDILKKNNWWSKGYFYVIDEAATKEHYDELVKKVEKIKKIAPDAKIVGTFCQRPEFAKDKTFVDLSDNEVNLWCIASWIYDTDKEAREQLHKKQNDGENLWWYVCCYPQNPYCNFFVDMNSMQHRLLFWQTKMNNIEGVLFWDTTYWYDNKNGSGPTLDPWTNIATWKNGKGEDLYGDGSLLYPGSKIGLNGPVPSVRLINIRDGIEDFEYLTILEKKCGRKAVDEMIAKTVKSNTEYNQNISNFENIRNEMAKMIEE